MSDMEEDEYGDIADEDLIEAFSQPSQNLPTLLRKRDRYAISDEDEDEDEDAIDERLRWRHQTSKEAADDHAESVENKKNKYRIHFADKKVPPAQIVGATQAEALEALPNSSPYRIRGPIYKKPRPEPSPSRPATLTLHAPSRPTPASIGITQRRAPDPIVIDDDDDFGLADLPSDAFSSQESNLVPNRPLLIGSSSSTQNRKSSLPSNKNLTAPQQGLRQTTLFGGRAPDAVPASQLNKRHNFIVDKPPELPTHHKLDQEALKTWVYPTNLGAIRDYQFSIVRNGLFNNLLVALPTGLGKTCIAATIMLNFFRWTKDAKIVFVAPTKPLVAQQVDACFNIVGIPKSQTTMLTGEQVPALRAEEWENKRVFFMTPQTLDNDLSSGIADPKKIVLLVVDEAHRATGNYAYVKVVKFLRRFNKSFRVLALTATPGSTVEAVQEVINNLEISKVEIRTEDSIDIQQYVHQRNIEQILLDPSEEIVLIKEHFSKALQPLVNQLCGLNAHYNKDPMSLTPFGMMQAKKKWLMSDAGRTASMGVKGMAHALFQILASIAHSIKLLNFHGISPFYSAVKEFRQSVEEKGKPSKYRNMIVQHPDFKKMMGRINIWISKDDFVGHPKLTYLCDTILNHFLDAGEGRLGDDAPPSATRVIVFSEFRDSAEDIVRILNKHGPLIRATVFVGQQDSKRSEGMNQAKQLETLKKFKSGTFNVIVATSIGEEGLDIGQVDLIVCYDASGSPIRMLQRMGRTGRKRAGKIVLLLMRGKEEDSFAKAKDNYEQMQKMITSGERFDFRHDLSVRILPRDIIPEVEKKMIEIPLENTQGPALPEPRRRATKLKKKPAKKFHMPDDVETGFTKASKLSADGTAAPKKPATTTKRKEVAQIEIARTVSPNSVFLTPSQEEEFEQRYLKVDYAGIDFVEIGMLDLASHEASRRLLGPTIKVPHGRFTKRNVELFNTLADTRLLDIRYSMLYGKAEGSRSFWNPQPLIDDELAAAPRKPHKIRATKAAQNVRVQSILDLLSDSEADESMHPSSSLPRSREREISFLDGAESEDEGEGDDVGSEARSEDSDDELGSLKDFLASGGGLSSQRSMVDIDVVRSSTTPEPTFEGHRLPTHRSHRHIVVSSNIEDPVMTSDGGNDDDVDGEVNNPMGRTINLSSERDEETRPMIQHRDNRRRILDSDSDE
jgi:ATP-dependent DNA helicase MPH1